MLYVVRWYLSDKVASLGALCPACGFEHRFNVDLENHGKWNEGSPVWDFDGNYDSPTFSPSMLHYGNERLGHPRCHSYLEAGVWRFLSDCEHEMAGQTVPMIPADPEMTWRQRHGWPEESEGS